MTITSRLFENESAPSTGLARPTSSEQVADHIRRLIFENRLRVGDRVPQDEIAAELRVSRVPVREAVIVLDREGWVQIEPHRGAFVVGLDQDSTRDHYELLGRVYGFGARRAAERAGSEGLDELGKLHRKLQATTDPHEFSQLNLEFLRRVVWLAHSRRVSATIRLMAVSIVPGDFFAEVPDAMRIHKRGMRAIMRALKEHDGVTAEHEFIAMLAQEGESVVALLIERGLIGGSD
ncbi:MAG TPA: GntR family transcriptional regulator [Pseudonocardiaceae bacterium]|jgi:DNA-binding GntR family transcriptional regulator|nr:GntR family transcriptional regulator [Pseudonocardiaceae bacterium]